MAPPYRTPDLPVSSVYGGVPSEQGAEAAATDWRGYFADRRLCDRIAEAIAHNRDLRTAVQRVFEARAMYGIQRADRFPTLDVQAGVDRARTPKDLTLPGQPQLFDVYQANLGLATWEIDLWGRLRSLENEALENFLATDAARRAITISLIAQVAQGEIGLREVDERIALARKTLDTRQESFRIFTRRVQVGSTSQLDLTQVRTLLTQAEALVAQLEQSRATQRNALTLLVGTPLDFTEPDSLDDGQILTELRPGLPSDLLSQRPDILEAEHQLRAANANIGAARAAFFPQVSLTGAYGTASTAFSGLFKSGSLAWSLAPLVTLPIFDGGRRRNDLSLSETRRDLAVTNYEKTVQVAFRDVSDALSSRYWLDRQVTIAREALDTQTLRARLARLRYDNGAAPFLDVLDAQRDLLDAEQGLVQTRRLLLSSRVNLYAALGGGSMTLGNVSEVDPP